MKFNVQTLFVFVFFFVCFLFFNCGSIVESCIFSNFLFGDNCIGFFRLSGFLALEVEASPLQHHPPHYTTLPGGKESSCIMEGG